MSLQKSSTNDFRVRLKRGDRLLGTMVTLACPSAAELLSGLGFDWLFVDGEHGPLETADLLAFFRQWVIAPRAWCVCREGNEVAIKKVLDLGAHGVIVPQVNSAQQAPTWSATRVTRRSARAALVWRVRTAMDSRFRTMSTLATNALRSSFRPNMSVRWRYRRHCRGARGRCRPAGTVRPVCEPGPDRQA